MLSSPRKQVLAAEATRAITAEAESLVRLWDRAEDWAVPRIPPSQLKVLSALGYLGSMNLNALADAFGASPSSTSRLCDRLEASGLVQRKVPDGNRREVRLSLTREGRRRLDSFEQARREDFSTVLDLMSPHARDALLEGLRQFGAAAQAAREDSATQEA